VSPFVSKDTARARARCFDPARALAPATFRGDSLACASAPAAPKRTASIELESPCGDEHAREMTVCHAAGTTAFAIADADGDAVAVTQTLGTWGGNFYVSPGLGFLYNDKLTTYGSDPNEYGARLPFARHGSTLAPTIVLDGTGPGARPILAVGAAGNAWITSAVYQTLVGVVDDHLDAQRALEQPRFLLGGRGGANGASVQVEDGLSPAVVRRLRAMGYRLDFISLPGELRMGYGAAVTLGRSAVTAGADPRRAGAAGAIP
jgi:gamma-glutamyltranspeptidase